MSLLQESEEAAWVAPDTSLQELNYSVEISDTSKKRPNSSGSDCKASKHQKISESNKEKKKFACGHCNHRYAHLHHLHYHEKNKHQIDSGKKLPCHKCVLCDSRVLKKDILSHFQNEHSVQMETVEFNLPSLAEFHKWKETIEKETLSSFIQERGSHKRKNYIAHYFICHRSGKFRSKGKGIRHMKTQGSNKIDGYCPASIKIFEDKKGNCTVQFQKTHLGHEHDIGHLYLLKSEREAIASKLKSNLPFRVILDEIRNSVSSESLSRLHLLTTRDLFNIQRDINLKLNPNKCENDAVGVEEADSNKEKNFTSNLLNKSNGVLTENFKEDDFVLVMNNEQVEMLKTYGPDCVCMDVIHGKDDHHLITLLVIDKLLQGYACAFFITNRIDDMAVSVFLAHVKDKVGALIPKVFMSATDRSFYSFWSSMMGEPVKHLFCSWDVDKAWRINIEKITGKAKQVEVHKTCKTLLKERDCLTFDLLLSQALMDWEQDPNTFMFCQCFRETFANCPTSWAYCYWLHSEINRNVNFEQIHKSIERIYLQGKSAQTFDKSINAIVKFVKDKLVDQLIVSNKGKITTKLRYMRTRHKKSLSSMDVVVETSSGWHVTSTSREEPFFVQEIEENCSCQLICTECNSCIHKYTCTCKDSSVRWNMCQHIHSVCQFRKQNVTITTSSCITNVSEDNSFYYIIETGDMESTVITEVFPETVVVNELSLQQQKDNLLGNLVPLIQSLPNKEELEVFKQLLSTAKANLAAIQK